MKSSNKFLRYTTPVVRELSVRMESSFAVSTDAWGDKELNPWGTAQTNENYE